MRMLTSFGILFAIAASVAASDDKTDRATLRGIKEVCVIVELTGPTQVGVPVSKDRLQTEIEGRVTASGLSINKEATACLFLHVQPLPALGRNKLPALGRNNKPVGLYALELSLQLMQTVSLTRDPSVKTYAPTWSVANMATLPAEDVDPAARQITVDLVDRFVQAYQSVNPK